MSTLNFGSVTSQPAATTAAINTTNTVQPPAANPGSNVSQLTFRQIQDYFNKWTGELQEQEAMFIEDATKVNSWDRSIMLNGEKVHVKVDRCNLDEILKLDFCFAELSENTEGIAKLQKTVDSVRAEHSKLERDLDYLKAQQQEFETLLQPLESSLAPSAGNSIIEPEREALYSCAENLDVQLQQMTEDLKEIIRHINDSNKPLEKADPISQIMKILNEHTDALQWIEDNSNTLKKNIDEISEVHKAFRQEHEKSLQRMFRYQ